MDVFKTRCVVTRDRVFMGHFDLDTIFIDGIPHVVFDWDIDPNGLEKPVNPVPLDPQHFHELKGWEKLQYLYERPVEDPRQLD